MSKTDINSFLALATNAIADKNYEEAIIQYNNALSLDESNIEALKGLGLAYLNLKEQMNRKKKYKLTQIKK